MSNSLAAPLVLVCLALLACLHFALQFWLNAREQAKAKASQSSLFEPKPGLDEEPPAQPAKFRYRMPLSLIVFMIFVITYYTVLLIVMVRYDW